MVCLCSVNMQQHCAFFVFNDLLWCNGVFNWNNDNYFPKGSVYDGNEITNTIWQEVHVHFYFKNSFLKPTLRDKRYVYVRSYTWSPKIGTIKSDSYKVMQHKIFFAKKIGFFFLCSKLFLLLSTLFLLSYSSM